MKRFLKSIYRFIGFLIIGHIKTDLKYVHLDADDEIIFNEFLRRKHKSQEHV